MINQFRKAYFAMSEIEKLSKAAYELLFFDRRPKIPGVSFEKRYTPYTRLRIVKFYISKYPDCTLTFIEQNPDKGSSYANRAKLGSKIMWFILKNRKTKKEKWLGRMEDGKWNPNN